MDENTITITKEALAEVVTKQVSDATKVIETKQGEILTKQTELETSMNEVKQKLIALPLEFSNIQVKEEKVHTFGHWMRAKLVAERDKVSVEKVLDDWEAIQHNCTNAYLKTKNMNASTLTDGGYWLREEYDAGIIPLVRAASIVRKAGARTVSLANGSRTFRVNTAGTTAYYTSENGKVAKTKVQGGLHKMIAKKLKCEVVVSNDLLRFSDIRADAEIEQDMAFAIAKAEDLAFLNGKGSNYEPKGLLKWMTAANAKAATGTAANNVKPDLKNAMKRVHILMEGLSDNIWFFITPTFHYGLGGLIDTLYQTIDWVSIYEDKKTLFGAKVGVSSNVPASTVIFADMSEAIIGEALNMLLTFTPNGTYTGDDGYAVSGAETDESVIVLTEENDFFMRYNDAISSITSATLGA